VYKTVERPDHNPTYEVKIMAKKKSTKLQAQAVSASDITRWKERLEEARVRAQTVEQLVKFKYEMQASQQEDDSNVAWYSEFHNGIIDDAVKYLASGAERELNNAVEWLGSLEVPEVGHV
jgi:hypothetical protein